MNTNIKLLGLGLGLGLVACSHDLPPRSPEQPIAVSRTSKAAAPRVTAAKGDPGSDASARVAERERGTLRDSGVATGLTNDQILEVTRTANMEEIQQAHVAHQRSRDPRVQKLAAMMMRDEVEAETHLQHARELQQELAGTDRSGTR